MKKRATGLLTALLLLMTLWGAAAAEDAGEAVDLSANCRLTASSNAASRKKILTGGLLVEHWPCAPGDVLGVETPDGALAQGIMVSFLGDAPELTVTAGDRVIAEYAEGFKSDYIAFDEPVSAFTITIGEGPERVKFKRLRVLSEGTLPSWVQRWERLEGPADVMLVATHPDDELLWFGGMLPTYAGERQKKVIVVHTVGSRDFRHLELLAALWACGVKYYPEIGCFPDTNASHIKEYQRQWGAPDAPRQYIAEQIRKYRPAVVVTHDVDGEYGHTHHRMTAEATIAAATGLSADPTWDEPTARRYGVWQPSKLYVHMWPEDETVFDWEQPLSAFDGALAIEVAREAFKLHGSQQSGRYSVQQFGPGDCRRFGLYWSSVGPDEAHNDLLEHIPNEF